MSFYRVGGCVRDALMGRRPKDIDYVVVGGTEADMLHMGFQKVGADFPVFLHPTTREEYALARTEKKTGVGYLGFETYFGPEVTLEQDLARRDFTINAMAMDSDTIYDPFNGQGDLKDGVIRHVNAQAFIEDPVRVLRAARFAARYDFIVDPETICLMENITFADLKSVPSERIMLELHKALDDGKGFQFLKNLESFGDLIFDMFLGTNFSESFWSIDTVYEKLGIDGVLCLLAEHSDPGYLDRFKASSDCKMLRRIIMVASQRHVFEPHDAYQLIQMSDYYRRPQFLENAQTYLQLTTLNICEIAKQMAKVTHADLPEGLSGPEIGKALKEKRKKVFDAFVGL